MLDPCRELHTRLYDIAALTASPYKVKRIFLSLWIRHGKCRIGSLIKAVTRIVCHAPVHNHIVFQSGQMLDRADGINRHACICHNASTRLHEDPRHGKTRLRNPLPDMLCQCKDSARYIDGLIRLQIAYAVSPAQIQFLCGKAQRIVQRFHKAHHVVNRIFKNHFIKHHGSHMAVEARNRYCIHRKRLFHEAKCQPVSNWDAELYIYLPRVDCFVGVRVNPGCNTEKHLLPDPLCLSLSLQALQFGFIVHDKVPDTGIQGIADIFFRFSVPVEIDFLRREACAEGRMDFTSRNRVNAQALF